MDVHISSVDRVPVLTLSGRFDGLGSTQFDDTTQSISSNVPFWVVDFSGVGYVSSVGLRSIVALEKTLRARDGGLILVGLQRPVRHLLEISNLDRWMRSAASVADAIKVASAASVGPAVEHVVSGRTIRARRAAGTNTLEWWDGAEDGPLVAVSLDDLGFAFGTGGFGASGTDARSALGTFVSTPAFAGVLPSGAHGVSDFMAGGVSAAMPIHVSTALAVSGSPTFVAEVSAADPFPVVAAVDDICRLVAAEVGPSPAMGFVVLGERAGTRGGLICVGILRDSAAPLLPGSDTPTLRDWRGQIPIAPGRTVAGGAVTLQSPGGVTTGTDVYEVVRAIASADAMTDIVGLDASDALARATIWIFAPSAIRAGAEKLLQIVFEGGVQPEPEWEAIVRRLYADCQSVTLTPLHGGYMSKTFRVVAYDRQGRRTLPTVLKIGPPALTAREEYANREYVARFILNNGTTVLGGAVEGPWAGLRYNFLGVNGPETQLVWLREHYLQRPTPQVVALFDKLLTRALKPWYAQPKWEQVSLYRDHSPLRLFPNLFDVAARELGISSDEPRLDCPLLGVDLPNPFHFLKHEYPVRAAASRLWYTTVCHGDLNMQNVLVDERENLYVIDFSETRPRNAVSDFARIEPIVKFEFPRLANEDDLQMLLEFEAALTSVTRLSELPPLVYRGNDPLVPRAHAVITLLRRAAAIVTLFEEDMVPYWLAMLEWTYSVVNYVQVSRLQKQYATFSAALVCRAIQAADASRGTG